MFDVTYCFVLIIQVPVEGVVASLALKSCRLTSSASSDVLHFTENLECIRSLEQQLKAMKGHADVAKSKAKAAADGEAFILESVKNMNKDLEGKKSTLSFFCPRILAFLAYIDFFLSVVFVVNPPEEAKRVSARLNALQSFSSSSAAGF